MRFNLTEQQLEALNTLPTFEMDKVALDRARTNIRNAKQGARERRKTSRFLPNAREALAGAAAIVLLGGTLWSIENQNMGSSRTRVATATTSKLDEFRIPPGLLSFQPMKLSDNLSNKYTYLSSDLRVDLQKDVKSQSYTASYGQMGPKKIYVEFQVIESPSPLKDGPLSGLSDLPDGQIYQGTTIRLGDGLEASTAKNKYGTVIGYVRGGVKYELISYNVLSDAELVQAANNILVPVSSVQIIETGINIFPEYKKEIQFAYRTPKPPTGYLPSEALVIVQHTLTGSFQTLYFRYQTQNEQQGVQIQQFPIQYKDFVLGNLSHAKGMVTQNIGGHQIMRIDSQYFWSNPAQGLAYEVGGMANPATYSMIESLFT